jgi:beta-galactosidase
LSKRININNDWLFLKESCGIEDLAAKEFASVCIPHTWNALDGQDGGDDYHRGLCWYKKTFTINEKIKGRAFIEFEAVNSVANVYLNGMHLGEHRGGYSLFRFDMTEHLSDGENELLVSADNSHIEDVYPLFADFTFYGGIYRDVNIVLTNEVFFDLSDHGSDGVYLIQREITKDRAVLEVKARISNPGEPKIITCKSYIKDSDGIIVADCSASIESTGITEITLPMEFSNPVLWHGIENPHIYNCETILTVDGETLDFISVPTGLRFFEFDGDKGFTLNGEQYRLNGVSRHQDREAVGNALTHEHQDEDMELIKEMGVNSIRLAHYQHNKYFYSLCDREGMVVWAEIPYISRTSEVEDYAANAISQMKELVKQNFNHSSIIMWGVQNEIGIFPNEKPLEEIVGTIDAVVKEIDTTRVTTQAQVMMIKEDDPANWKTDVVAFNQYHGWYVGDTGGYDKFINDFRKANPEKSLGYSEYGAEGIISWHSDDPKVKDYTEEYHSKFHEEVMATFNKYEFIWGTYVWNMFDFGSDMRDEGGVKGRNNKGLVTFDRSTKKDAYYFYKSMWNDEPMVHICSKRFVDRHTKTINVKVYSNLNSVILYLNGRELETKSSSDNVYIFEVKLKKGKNTITAKAGTLSDTAVFNKVRKQNMDYVLPETEKDKGLSLDSLGPDENVANWFDQNSEIGEYLYPDDSFSLKDRIIDIMDNPEGEALMNKYLKPLVEHSMFKFIKKQSLEAIFTYKPDAVPEAMKYKINCELNKIKK